MHKDQVEEFAARWLERYGKPWDCDDVRSFASMETYRRYRVAWAINRRLTDFANILLEIARTAHQQIKRIALEQPPSQKWRGYLSVVESTRASLNNYLNQPVRMSGRSLGFTLDDLVRGFQALPDMPARIPVMSLGAYPLAVEELGKLVDAIEASASLELASAHLAQLFRRCTADGQELQAYAGRLSPIPRVRDPALAAQATLLARWMRFRGESPSWNDVYDCLCAHGHDLRHLGSRGYALKTMSRRLEDALTA